MLATWSTLALKEAQLLSQTNQESKQGKGHLAYFGQAYEKCPLGSLSLQSAVSWGSGQIPNVMGGELDWHSARSASPQRGAQLEPSVSGIISSGP